MKNLLLSLALISASLCPAALLAAPPTLTLPAEVKGDVGAYVTVPATTTGKTVQWLVLDPGLNLFPIELLKDSKTAVVSSSRKGRYRLLAYTAAADEASAPAVTTVNIGDAPAPTPVPPEPPPTPPTPVDPSPFPAAGLRVLIVEETANRSTLPPAQLAILFDQRVHELLNSKCVQDTEIGRKAWNIWDADEKLEKAPKLWQDAMKRPRKSVPWIMIGNGKTGYEGPLPENVDKTLELIKKYAE
jgi:hypothetical protein